MWGGGGGRAWFSRAIVFAIRFQLSWRLDRVLRSVLVEAGPILPAQNEGLSATAKLRPACEVSQAIAFAIRIRSSWRLDRIPLKHPCRDWADPTDAERKSQRDQENGAIEKNAQPLGNPRDARVTPGYSAYSPFAAAGRTLFSREAPSLAVAQAWTRGA